MPWFTSFSTPNGELTESAKKKNTNKMNVQDFFAFPKLFRRGDNLATKHREKGNACKLYGSKYNIFCYLRPRRNGRVVEGGGLENR
jgi:hypothetical protein